MFKYKAFDLSISSEIELPELLPCEYGDDVHIKFGKLNVKDEVPLVEGKNFRVTGKGTFLFWDDVGTICVKKGKTVILDPVPDIDPDFLRLFILGVSFGVILHQRGFLVLHASSVSVNGKGVAFIGNSGQGKSTTAFSLILNGHGLVSDDVLPVKIEDGKIRVYPGFPALKLTRNTVLPFKNFEIKPNFSKYFYSFKDGFTSSPLKLEHIFILEQGNKLAFNDINLRKALMSLVKNSYCIKLFMDGENRDNLLQCSEIVKKVPITSLKFYKSLPELTKISEFIEKQLNDG